MSDERGVQRSLADWLDDNGFNVFWDRDPPDEYRHFTVDDMADLPDLAVVGDEHTIVIEVKDGDDSSSIYDSMAQVHRYWWQFERGESELVLSDSKTTAPTAVAIGTQYSPRGYLFKKEREQGWRKTYDDDDGWWNVGMRPQYEYARTESISRILWRYAWEEIEATGEDRSAIQIGIGTLLSEALDESPKQTRLGTPSPKLLAYDGVNNAYWESIK